jgi:hypothetical protein
MTKKATPTSAASQVYPFVTNHVQQSLAERRFQVNRLGDDNLDWSLGTKVYITTNGQVASELGVVRAAVVMETGVRITGTE